MADITLNATRCDNNNRYVVTFSTEAQALDFIDRKGATHAFDWDEGVDLTPALWEKLDPSCEHGLSQWLCYGPGHYPPDNHY